MADNQDRRTGGFHPFVKFSTGCRVEVVGRLVEQNDFRGVDHQPGEINLSPLATAQTVERSIETSRRQPPMVERSAASRLHVPIVGQSIEMRRVGTAAEDGFQCREFLRDTQRLRHVRAC